MAWPLFFTWCSPSRNILQSSQKWKEILQKITTINWSEKLARGAVIIARASLMQKSKRHGVIISELSSLQSRKRLLGVDINSTINLISALWEHPTISWSLELVWVAIVIAVLSWTQSSNRFCACVAVIIAELSWQRGSKRLGVWILAVKIAEPKRAWSKGLSLLFVALLALDLAGCKKHSTSLFCIAFVIAVVFARTWFIVAVIVAVIAEKAWGAVMSFKLE